jgi:hypothetical protein
MDAPTGGRSHTGSGRVFMGPNLIIKYSVPVFILAKLYKADLDSFLYKVLSLFLPFDLISFNMSIGLLIPYDGLRY